jgi:hypothetical protein
LLATAAKRKKCPLKEHPCYDQYSAWRPKTSLSRVSTTGSKPRLKPCLLTHWRPGLNRRRERK